MDVQQANEEAGNHTISGEQARLEAALRDVESHYHSLFQAIDSGFCIVEMKFDNLDRPVDYRLVEVNPAFERQTGLCGAAGRWVSDVAPDLERHWFDIYGRVALTGEATRFENYAEPLGRWFDVHAFRTGEAAQRRVAILFTDITARKDVETRLRNLNDTLEAQVLERTAERDRMWAISPDLMLVIGFDGVFLRVNPAWTRLLGYLPDDLVGHHVSEFIEAADQGVTTEAYKSAAHGESPRVVNRYRHKNGGTRWISWVAAPAGGVTYATGRDVTFEKEQAAALDQAQEALRQSQKMEAIGQLTGGIAHDFNNMLATISSSLELMNRRIASGKGGDLTRYLTLASTAAQSAAALIKRLLAFSRKQTLDLQALEVNALIAQMQDMLKRSIGEHIQFELALQPGLPAVKSDRNQLENALLNLAINARDAMPEGGVIRIATSTRELDASYAAMHPEVTPGQYVMVSVSDNGTGMSPEVLVKAFDPFFTTKPIGQGTGLGLSMIYGFTRQIRGHASIHSILGKGTTVNIYLPCNMTTLEVPVTQQQLVARSPKGQGETVLFVEDEPGVRQVLSEILEELGYDTHEAIDASSALEIEQTLGPLDLLVTDVGLPGTNGRQLAEMMRERRPGLRILFVTGYASKAETKSEFLGQGMDMLAKPFTIDALAHKVQMILKEPVIEKPVFGIDGESVFGDLP